MAITNFPIQTLPATASNVANVPSGTITATNVQDAIDQLAAGAVREVLQANRTYYVRTDGNDSNTGMANTVGGAFLTPTHAINVIQALDLNQHTVILHIGTGTWFGGPYQIDNILGNDDGDDGLIVEGNGSANTSIQLQFDGFTNALVRAIKLDAGTGDNFASLWAGEHSEVFIGDDVIFNAAGTINTDIYAYDYGAVTALTSAYSVRGAGTRSSHVRLQGSSRFGTSLQPTAIAVADSPTFSIGFIRVQYNGQVSLGNSFTSSGTATGKKYAISGYANFDGAVANLPGTLPGTSELFVGPNESSLTNSVSPTFVASDQIYNNQVLSAPAVAGGVYLADVFGSGGATPHYGYLRLRIDDVTGASEDATWRFGAIIAGTHTDVFGVGASITMRLASLTNAANDAAAAGAGVVVGQLYRNGSILMIRVA